MAKVPVDFVDRFFAQDSFLDMYIKSSMEVAARLGARAEVRHELSEPMGAGWKQTVRTSSWWTWCLRCL